MTTLLKVIFGSIIAIGTLLYVCIALWFHMIGSFTLTTLVLLAIYIMACTMMIGQETNGRNKN